MHHGHIEIVTVHCQAHIVFSSSTDCPSMEIQHPDCVVLEHIQKPQ
jgi:hypothetical protein